ncbi:MAG: hypothetical protein ACOC56_00930, partial [Atribacterota bacterium]
MEKILELLKVEKLNEDQQKEIKQKLDDIVDIKVKEKIDEKMVEEKESLVSLYEEKFEEYKQDITSKFSNFVDSVLEEEMQIPEKVVEFSRKGELYHDLIEQFKIRLGIDEGSLDEEARELLKEARDEIVKLQEEINDLYKEKLQLEKDAKDFAAELYKMEKCSGLTEDKKEMVINLLEDVSTKEEIDRKFDFIVNQKQKDEIKEENTEDG